MGKSSVEIVSERFPRSVDIVSNISRDGFIELINGLMGGVVSLNNTLNSMESIFSDPTIFEELPIPLKLSLYKALSQRHSSMVGGVNKVFDLAVKSEFNRNFFGLSQEEAEQQQEVGDTEPLSREARVALAEIAKRINGQV